MKKSVFEKTEIAIAEAMDAFDFERMHKVMGFLNWRWGFENAHVPSVQELKSTAKSMLKEAFDRLLISTSTERTLVSGGFKITVFRIKEDDKYVLDGQIEFIIG